MARTIFWSWQSDEPQRETRAIIREALNNAIEQLGADLEEADRPELDHDTKGAPGSPEIVKTILNKIEAASVFVADVTPVAITSEGKQIPNPNVMLELGYARKILGLDRVIMVWNMAIFSSKFSDLPFDLQGLGKSCGFELTQGASTSDYRVARAELTKHLKFRLEETLVAANKTPPLPEAEWHDSMPAEPSIWLEGYNPLPVNFPHQGRVDVIVEQAPRIYARLLPARHSPPPTSGTIFPTHEAFLKPLGDRNIQGISFGRTANGYIASAGIGDNRITKTISRWYKDNGEIWAISTWGFYQRGEHPHLGYDDVAKDLARWLEQSVRTSIAAGGTAPFRVRMGASGIQKVQWWQSRPDPLGNPFFGLKAVTETELTLVDGSPTSVLAAVVAFMDDMTDAFGVARLEPQSIAILLEQA